MSASNLPPGCSPSDIPGNTPEDEAWDRLFNDMLEIGLTAREARARWDSAPQLLRALKHSQESDGLARMAIEHAEHGGRSL